MNFSNQNMLLTYMSAAFHTYMFVISVYKILRKLVQRYINIIQRSVV